jgi:hypothetical protein
MPGNPAVRRTGVSDVARARTVIRTKAQSSAIDEAIGGLKKQIQQTTSYPASTPGVERASGFIEMWAGAIADIPAGYQLCDGTNGTPDLRNLFLRCCNTGEEPGLTGGTISHTHEPDTLAVVAASAGTPSGSIGAHGSASDTAVTGAGTRITDGTHSFAGDALGTHTHSLTGETEEVVHLPPYYKLAFVMRVG